MEKLKRLCLWPRQQWARQLQEFNNFAVTRSDERFTGRELVLTVIFVLTYFLGLGLLITDDQDQPRTVLTLRKYVDSCLIAQVDIDPTEKASGSYVKSTNRQQHLPPPQNDQEMAERILQDAQKIFAFNPGDRVAVTYDPVADECRLLLLVRDPDPRRDQVYVRSYAVDQQGQFHGPQQTYTISEEEVTSDMGDLWLELPTDYQPLLAARPRP